MAAWNFLIVDADGTATGTDDREQAELYAKNDDTVVIDCANRVTIDEDGDELDDISEADPLVGADDEAEED